MRSDFSHFQTKHAAKDFECWAHVVYATRYSLLRTTYQALGHSKGREQKRAHSNSKLVHRGQIYEISIFKNSDFQ